MKRLALVLIAGTTVSAAAGEYSVAKKEIYRDDVTTPTVYQNFVLSSRPKKALTPTTLTCTEFRTNFYYLKQQLTYLEDRLKQADRVVISYPATYDLAIRALFSRYKQVTFRARPSGKGEIVIKICSGR